MGEKRFSAKAWGITIVFCDALGLAALAFISYLTWSFYQQNGRISPPVGFSTLLYVPLFIVIRGIAVKEKKKALNREGEES
ncbi:MAG: hypothetical protein RIS54_1979 [Verrucomicrobiota bacterium]|jgi:hypothetical protein